MWARRIELSLALWLAASPWVMPHEHASWIWAHDLSIAAIIATLALISHIRRLARAHALLLLVAIWLMGFGWWQVRGHAMPAPASYQNWIVIGLLLGVFSIVPRHVPARPRHRHQR